MILAFCGQPRSGKTTLAQELRRRGVVDLIVEGEDIRAIHNPGYDDMGRHLNIGRAQIVAQYLNRVMGLDVALCLVSPYRDFREALKNDEDEVHEIYLRTDEVRGLEHYAAEDFEPPRRDFIEIDTGQFDISHCADLVEEFIHDA